MEKLRRCRSSEASGVCPASPPCPAHGVHKTPLKGRGSAPGLLPPIWVSPQKHGLTLQKPKLPLLRCKTEAQPEQRIWM